MARSCRGGSVYATAAQAGECAPPQLDVWLPGGLGLSLGLVSLTFVGVYCVARGTSGKILGLNISERTVRNYYYQWIHYDSNFFLTYLIILRDKRGVLESRRTYKFILAHHHTARCSKNIGRSASASFDLGRAVGAAGAVLVRA